MTGGRQMPAAPADAGRAAVPVVRDIVLLMTARWRIAVRALRGGARWRRATYGAVALALAFLGLVALVVSYALTAGITELTAPQVGRSDVVVAVTLSGVVTLSVLVSFTVALAALYLSADLDLLLAAPVSRRAVFVSKLLGGLMPAHAVLLLMAVVPLIGHGLAHGYGRGYYGAVLLALALLPALPAAVGAVAVMIIVRRVSAHRLGNVVALVIGAMTLSIALVAGGASQLQEAISLGELLDVFDRLRSPLSPAEWLTRGVTAAGRLEYARAATWLGFTTLLSLLGLVTAAVIARRLYFSGWAHMQSADRRREMRDSRLPWNRVDNASSLGRPSGAFRWLSPPTVAIIRKDLRVIPRDLTSMAQVLSPLAIGVFFVLQRLLYPVRLGAIVRSSEMLEPLLVMLSAGIASAVSAMIMSRFCLTAFSIEGRAYWVLKAAPVARRDVLAAKFLVAYLPLVGLGWFLVVLLEVARVLADARAGDGPQLAALAGSFDVALVGYAWLVVAVLGAGVLAINLALGAARPNLRWDTPHEMLMPDVGCLSLVTYGAYGFVAGGALMVPAAMMGFPLLGNPLVIWTMGLGLGLGVTVIVVATAYRLALREMPAIGE